MRAHRSAYRFEGNMLCDNFIKLSLIDDDDFFCFIFCHDANGDRSLLLFFFKRAEVGGRCSLRRHENGARRLGRVFSNGLRFDTIYAIGRQRIISKLLLIYLNFLWRTIIQPRRFTNFGCSSLCGLGTKEKRSPR